MVRAKIILQHLWQARKKWNEDITDGTRTNWIHWKTKIALLENISIPRRVLCENPMRIELHGFSDASEAVYGACMYVRSVNSKGEYTVRLLCAKSRKAPIKKNISTKIRIMCSRIAGTTVSKGFLSINHSTAKYLLLE